MLGSFFTLILRSAWRHRLRASLTQLGMMVAILAFGLLGTVVDAWYAGAEGASAKRLVTRSAISLVFPLPLTYRERIRAVDGVRDISWASWFGGIYKEPRNFFPQFAVEGDSYFRLYPEFLVEPGPLRDFLRDRRGCVVGRKLAETYGFKVGDTLTLKGTIYPGNWDFVIRAIYDGATKGTDRAQMFFHWAYLDESVKKRVPGRGNEVGVFVVEVASDADVAAVSRAIDAEFVNSRAETLTETEKAFQLGFVAMTGALVAAIRIVSYLVIFIIMAVMANTMAMSARERTAEYATLRALGFPAAFVALMILGESLLLALGGGLVGIALTFPVARVFAAGMGTLFPVFNVSGATVLLQAGAALTVGVVAALLPMRRVARLSIVDGLRAVG